MRPTTEQQLLAGDVEVDGPHRAAWRTLRFTGDACAHHRFEFSLVALCRHLRITNETGRKIDHDILDILHVGEFFVISLAESPWLVVFESWPVESAVLANWKLVVSRVAG